MFITGLLLNRKIPRMDKILYDRLKELISDFHLSVYGGDL